MTRMDAGSLLELRKKAQAAVADMPDGDLKLKAFELILNRLLAAEDAATATERGAGKRVSKGEGRRAAKSTKSGATVGVVSDSTPARILSLKADGYFKEERGIGEIQDELRTRGWIYDVTALSAPLMRLLHEGELRRRKAPDGNKTIFKYFNP